MRGKMLLTSILASLALFVLGAGVAAAQSPCDSVNLTLDPTHGYAGGSVTATGGNLMGDTETEFYWDSVAPENFLGQVLSSPSGDFTFNFAVPSAAGAGVHQVIVSSFFANESPVECSADFTVDESVQQNSYPGVQATATTTVTRATPATATSLPRTGLFLMIPASGLALGGLGGLLLKRQYK